MSVEKYQSADFDNVCAQCLTYQKKFLKRRILEKKLIIKYENIETESKQITPKFHPKLTGLKNTSQ